MLHSEHISVIIPALDEEQAIGKVVAEFAALRNPAGGPLIDDIIVCDNGSSDATGQRATEAGARVVWQPERGYGAACLTAMAALGQTDIVLFVDGDDSCPARHAHSLLAAVSTPPNGAAQRSHLAIGSRTLGAMEPGALTLPQRFGNALAAGLIRLLWRHQVTDLGPYRAVRQQALGLMHMADRRFGWTIEMQIKAIQLGLHTVEVPVDTRRRIGQSKISGTLRGVVGAARGILGTLFKLRWQQAEIISQARRASLTQPPVYLTREDLP